jgi:CheY-like chemotaxis protein
VSFEGHRENGSQLHFSVRDTGIGIPQEKHSKIFQALEQADASTTRKSGGTGLGLAISSRIVELMGGRVWVESVPGHGSTFQFTTRFQVANDNAKLSLPDDAELLRSRNLGQQASSAVPATEGGNYAALRILLAEDNVVNQTFAIAILKKMGHQVALAVNGAEAVSKWSEGEFDLIIMDVQMPEMDGFEVTKRIREQERISGAHIPIIAMTAHAMSGDSKLCIDAGMDEYVSKPVNRKTLEQAIHRSMKPNLADIARKIRSRDVLMAFDFAGVWTRTSIVRSRALQVSVLLPVEFQVVCEEWKDLLLQSNFNAIHVIAIIRFVRMRNFVCRQNLVQSMHACCKEILRSDIKSNRVQTLQAWYVLVNHYGRRIRGPAVCNGRLDGVAAPRKIQIPRWILWIGRPGRCRCEICLGKEIRLGQILIRMNLFELGLPARLRIGRRRQTTSAQRVYARKHFRMLHGQSNRSVPTHRVAR